MKLNRWLGALPLLTIVAGCSDSSGEESLAGSESELVSACAGDYKLVSFVASPSARSGVGRSGAGARTFVADADGDGRADVIHVAPGASDHPYVMGAPMTFDVTIHPTDAQGALGPAEQSTIAGHHARAFYGGDFDGDGRFDVAYLTYAGDALWVALRDASGGWKPPVEVAVPLCGALTHLYMRPGSVVVRDFDGDGRADLLANIRNDDLHAATIVLHGGATGLDNGSCLSVTNGWDTTRRWPIEHGGTLVVGDFDGDTKLDAFARDGDKGVAYSDIFGGATRMGFPSLAMGHELVAFYPEKRGETYEAAFAVYKLVK